MPGGQGFGPRVAGGGRGGVTRPMSDAEIRLESMLRVLLILIGGHDAIIQDAWPEIWAY